MAVVQNEKNRVSSKVSNHQQENGANNNRADKIAKPPLSVVVRHLPAKMNEEEFTELVSPLPDYDYLCYIPADTMWEEYAYCLAYIHFCQESDLLLFTEKFDGYMCVDEKGNESELIVEYSPYQLTPKFNKQKKNLKEGTVLEDKDYLTFVDQITASLNKPASGGSKLDQYLQEVELKHKKLNDNNLKVSTPLTEYINHRKEVKKAARERAKVDRKRKEDVRRKQKEDDRHSRRKDSGDKSRSKKLVGGENRRYGIERLDEWDKGDDDDGYSESGRHIRATQREHREGKQRPEEWTRNQRSKDENYNEEGRRYSGREKRNKRKERRERRGETGGGEKKRNDRQNSRRDRKEGRGVAYELAEAVGVSSELISEKRKGKMGEDDRFKSGRGRGRNCEHFDDDKVNSELNDKESARDNDSNFDFEERKDSQAGSGGETGSGRLRNKDRPSRQLYQPRARGKKDEKDHKIREGEGDRDMKIRYGEGSSRNMEEGYKKVNEGERKHEKRTDRHRKVRDEEEKGSERDRRARFDVEEGRYERGMGSRQNIRERITTSVEGDGWGERGGFRRGERGYEEGEKRREGKSRYFVRSEKNKHVDDS